MTHRPGPAPPRHPTRSAVVSISSYHSLPSATWASTTEPSRPTSALTPLPSVLTRGRLLLQPTDSCINSEALVALLKGVFPTGPHA